MSKLYVLQYEDGSLVGIDQASGGYHWKAYRPNGMGSLSNVRFWSSEEEALKYKRIFNELELKEFKFQVL